MKIRRQVLFGMMSLFMATLVTLYASNKKPVTMENLSLVNLNCKLEFALTKEKLTDSKLKSIKADIFENDYIIHIYSQDKSTIYIGEIVPEIGKEYNFRKIHFSEIENMWINTQTETLQLICDDRFFGEGSWIIFQKPPQKNGLDEIKQIQKLFVTTQVNGVSRKGSPIRSIGNKKIELD